MEDTTSVDLASWSPQSTGERGDITMHSLTVRKAKKEMDGCLVGESEVEVCVCACTRMCEQPLQPRIREDTLRGRNLSCDNSLLVVGSGGSVVAPKQRGRDLPGGKAWGV